MSQRHPTPGPWLLTLILALAALALAPQRAEAKDLQKRFGVGAYVQPGLAPAISLKFGIPAENKAVNVQIGALAGGRFTPAGGNQTLGGLRVQTAVVAEDHMNLFVALTGLYLYDDDGAGTVFQGFDARLTAGAEFFLFGLDNLGLSVEAGGELLGDTVSGAVDIKVQTTGALSFHYYF